MYASCIDVDYKSITRSYRRQNNKTLPSNGTRQSRLNMASTCADELHKSTESQKEFISGSQRRIQEFDLGGYKC